MNDGDRTQFREDATRILDLALDAGDEELDRDEFEDKLRAALRDRFTIAELRRLEKVFEAVSAAAFLEYRHAEARRERARAFEHMTDDEIRKVTGGTLIGTLAYRPPLRVVQGGDAA